MFRLVKHRVRCEILPYLFLVPGNLFIFHKCLQLLHIKRAFPTIHVQFVSEFRHFVFYSIVSFLAGFNCCFGQYLLSFCPVLIVRLTCLNCRYFKTLNCPFGLFNTMPIFFWLGSF
uniref:Uncharacterized protein n=1 Tax=Cacopsylla melanoneura TaxID=428564 RepID=A0A8D9AJZ7_9HEMI